MVYFLIIWTSVAFRSAPYTLVYKDEALSSTLRCSPRPFGCHFRWRVSSCGKTTHSRAAYHILGTALRCLLGCVNAQFFRADG